MCRATVGAASSRHKPPMSRHAAAFMYFGVDNTLWRMSGGTGSQVSHSGSHVCAGRLSVGPTCEPSRSGIYDPLCCMHAAHANTS